MAAEVSLDLRVNEESQPQGNLRVLAGEVELALLAECDRQVVVGRGEVVIQVDGGLVLLDGISQLLLVPIEIPQIAAGLRRRRALFDGAKVGPFGLIQLSC